MTAEPDRYWSRPFAVPEARGLTRFRDEVDQNPIEELPLGAEGGEWDHTLILYLWLAGAQGVVESANGTDRINEDFSDLVENVEGGAIVALEGRKGQWGYIADLQYLELEGEDDSAGVDVEFSADTTLFEVDATYSPRGQPSLQFLVGLRFFDISTEVAVPGVLEDDDSTTVVDPVLGAIGTWELDENWLFRTRADFGGFGIGSETTYQLAAVFRRGPPKGWGWSFGFRIMGWDISDGGVETDLRMSGPLFGIDYSS